MKKKNIITVLILSLLFSAQNVWRDADAKTEQEQINEVDKNIQLSEVVADVEYPDAVTNEQEWEVNKENKYEFPIDCEDGQWSQYGTHDEMLEACTVPDKVLEDATTEQLLDMVLDYPLLCDIYVTDE